MTNAKYNRVVALCRRAFFSRIASVLKDSASVQWRTLDKNKLLSRINVIFNVSLYGTLN